MVSFSAVALLASTLLGAAIAAPVAEPEASPALVRRAPVGFQTCRDYNFQNCATWAGEENACWTLNSDWNNQASSLKVLTPGYQCYIYDGGSCTGDIGGPIRIDNPHANLGDFNWNDRVSSYRCFST